MLTLRFDIIKLFINWPCKSTSIQLKQFHHSTPIERTDKSTGIFQLGAAALDIAGIPILKPVIAMPVQIKEQDGKQLRSGKTAATPDEVKQNELIKKFDKHAALENTKAYDAAFKKQKAENNQHAAKIFGKNGSNSAWTLVFV